MKNKSFFYEYRNKKNDENSVINFNISWDSNIEAYAASNASRSEIITTMVASGDAFCRWSVEEIKALQLKENYAENFNFLVFMHW